MRYQDAGVHLDAAQAWVSWLRQKVGDVIGPFASGVPLDDDSFLVGTTDGVGTKILLLHIHQRWDTAGKDVVGMCLNDLYAVGATPIGFYDYIALPSLKNTTPVQRMMEGLLSALEEAGVPLLGGETAELPGFFLQDVPFDVAGFAMGRLPRSYTLKKNTVEPGDLIVGIPSSGPHSNGYSLIRSILDQRNPEPEIMEALLAPTRVYTHVPELFAQGIVKAAAHITGGGLEENLLRALPEGIGAQLDIRVPKVFQWLIDAGQVAWEEAVRVWNMGIGFALVVPPGDLGPLLHHYPDAKVVGEVVKGRGVKVNKEVGNG